MPPLGSLLVGSRDEAEAAMAVVAALTLQLNEVVNSQNGALLAARKFDDKIKEFQRRLERYHQALEEWALKNRKEFGESKTLDLRQGTISFHRCPPSVQFLRGWTEALVLVKLRKVKLFAARYIRVKESLNKQMILADVRPETYPQSRLLTEDKLKVFGLEISREEKVKIEPKLEAVPAPPG